MWVVFYKAMIKDPINVDPPKIVDASVVKWSMFPPSNAAGRVEADGFICSKRCIGKPLPRDYFDGVS